MINNCKLLSIGRLFRWLNPDDVFVTSSVIILVIVVVVVDDSVDVSKLISLFDDDD